MAMMTTKARIMTLRLAHAVDVAGFCFCEGKDFLELWEKTGGVAQDVSDLRKEESQGFTVPIIRWLFAEKSPRNARHWP
ncbi:hypothetical protein SLEP1_g40942 [Rubroshorea leprosula]|uniref:Uncharacterized protein n=1 Tax=Rubroshorea leprosula TaxID=152421 RepID=A0AAV5L4Z7_9ROSI|nr:hypothetical protein SLEP1_g40942 [Rubroshorea leprosula]